MILVERLLVGIVAKEVSQQWVIEIWLYIVDVCDLECLCTAT